MRKGFTLVEIAVVVAVVGIAAAAALTSAVPIIERARRDDQARTAMLQIRRMRALALTADEGGAVEVEPMPSGVRITTASVPRALNAPRCQNYDTRATHIERREYSLLDITVPRPDNTLCFDSSAFQLLDVDQLTPAAAPSVVDFSEDGGASIGSLVVAPSGAFTSTFEDASDEGLAATVNTVDVPPVDDTTRNIVEPRVLEPELPVYAAPPPDPTTPVGQPAIDALPPPTGDPPPPPPPACNVPGDCAPGFTCISNNCEPDPASCVDDSGCPADSGCVAGVCTVGACNSAACPNFPSCTTQCQMLDCCVEYGCLCI